MAGIYDLSKTPASNTPLINVGTIAAPGDVDDAIRNLASYVAKWRDDIGCQPTTGGSANAQTLTTNSVLVSGTLGDGVIIGFTAGFTNTGAMTLNPDGLGAVDVKKYGPTGLVALTGGEVQAGGKYIVVDEASTADFILINPTPRQAWEFIGDTAASGATTVDFTSLSTYRVLRATASGVTAGTDAVNLGIRVSVSGTFQTAATDYYNETSIQTLSGGLIRWGSSGNTTYFPFCQVGSAADEVTSFEVTLPSFNEAKRTMAWWRASSVTSDGEIGSFVGGGLTPAAAYDGVRFLASTGTISGRFLLEGLR